jgi:TetR/AcrR family transcriptional regulator, transcriptional repressor for nem operon
LKRKRNPAKTRRLLLQAGFQEIYLRGFQSASVDNILKDTRVTKGAFFHHFPSKTALGYAVVDEVISSMISAQWERDYEKEKNPLQAILDSFEGGIRFLEQQPVNLGCPLNNLAQEMSPMDRGFRDKTRRVFEKWMRIYEGALRAAKKRGLVRKSLNTREAAFSLVAMVEGTLSLAKNSQDPKDLWTGLRSVRDYFRGLKE